MRGSTSNMLDYLAALARQLRGFQSEYIILIMLMELEFVEHHDGFEYLRTAIYVFGEEREQLIAQGLYSVVAMRCGRDINEAVVERSIRTAIDAAWKSHADSWNVFFPSGERPSNIRFIARMAKYLELWKGCCKAYEQQSKKEGARLE